MNVLNSNTEIILLGDLVKQKRIEMKRGKIIAKTTGKYPVYSSSVKNNGLMCYSDDYMFNEELITWSIDGGGNFFYRHKHKYSLTNVSGYIRVLDKNINYKYLYCILSLLHSKEHFDYTTKAHPSVICKMYKIPLPNIKIQEKIANILFEIENKAIKQEQIITKLKEVKQSFLKCLFPNENTYMPQLRFRNFTDTWEQCKLKNIAEFNPKSILPTTFEYVDLESVVGTEMVSHRTERKNTAPSRAQRLAQTGDIFYQTVRPYQKNNYLFDKIENNYVFSTGYAQIRPYINSYFLMSFLQTENFVKVVLNNCTGTSYPAINSTDLSNLKLKTPKSQKEQEQIGLLFYNIDNLITLHQCKSYNLFFIYITLKIYNYLSIISFNI